MTWSYLITISKSYAAENEPNKTWMKIDLLKISVILVFYLFLQNKKMMQDL